MIDLGAGPFAVINPEITWRSDELFEVWDGLLERAWAAGAGAPASIDHGRVPR